MNPNGFRFYEAESEILEAVANSYARGSREYSAVRLAAFALLYAVTEHSHEFSAFVQRYANDDLTDAQRMHLVELGLDPGAS